MGKKSRAKQERRQQNLAVKDTEVQEEGDSQQAPLEKFLLGIIRYGVMAALLTPLILSSKFYFPFVGPKSLFFMAFCQVVFFAWLILILNYKQYRPKLNYVLIAFGIFLLVILLSTIFGVDPSRSFWSKFERMTGSLMWLHLFGFFLAVSSSFKKLSDWKRTFLVSIFIAILLSIFALLEQEAGIKALNFSIKKGSTLGNTSFLGTYLLFNAFFACWLFWQYKSKVIKLLSILCIVLGIWAMDSAGARAATWSTIAGIALIALLFISFYVKKKWLRVVGKVILIISVISVITILALLLFFPNSFVQKEFIDRTSLARPVNWQMAQQGFLEKPLLGWGPENYTVLFPKFFDPCLFTPECGGEIWFDRTHNIVFDTLATTGVFGFLAYLGLFGALFYVLGKKYIKQKSIDFWTFAVFSSLPVAYFIQNLTVFDMAVSLMLFVLTLAFGAFLITAKKQKPLEMKLGFKRRGIAVLFIIIFLITLSEFVVQPLRADNYIIKALVASGSIQRVEYYKKALVASPLGRYQIRDFFAQQSHTIIQNNIQDIIGSEQIREAAKNELDFLTEILEQSVKQAPIDYRSTLKLAQNYNFYTPLGYDMLALAEQAGNKAIELSPTNQQGYWALAQTKVYQKDFEKAIELAEYAIELEPDWVTSYTIAAQIARFGGNMVKAEEIAQRAIIVNPNWRAQFNNILGTSTVSAITIPTTTTPTTVPAIDK